MSENPRNECTKIMYEKREKLRKERSKVKRTITELNFSLVTPSYVIFSKKKTNTNDLENLFCLIKRPLFLF